MQVTLYSVFSSIVLDCFDVTSERVLADSSSGVARAQMLSQP